MKIRERDPQSTPSVPAGVFPAAQAPQGVFMSKKLRKKKAPGETTADQLEGPANMISYNPTLESTKGAPRATTASSSTAANLAAKRESNSNSGAQNLRITPLEYSQLGSEEASHGKIGGSLAFDFGNKSPKGFISMVGPLGQLYSRTNNHMLSLGTSQAVVDQYPAEDSGTPVGKNHPHKHRILSGNAALSKTEGKLASTPSGGLSKLTTNSMASAGLQGTAKKKRPTTGGAPAPSKQRLKSAKPKVKTKGPQMGLIVDSGLASKSSTHQGELRRSLEKFTQGQRPGTGTSKSGTLAAKKNGLELGIVAQNSIEDIDVTTGLNGNSKLIGLRESKESSHLGIHGSASKKQATSQLTGFAAYHHQISTNSKLSSQQSGVLNKQPKQFGKLGTGQSSGDYDTTSSNVKGLNLFQSSSITNTVQYEAPYFSQRGPSSRAEARRDRELQTHTSNNPRKSEKAPGTGGLLGPASGTTLKKREEGSREPGSRIVDYGYSKAQSQVGGHYQLAEAGRPATGGGGQGLAGYPGASVLASPAKVLVGKPLGKNSSSLLERGAPSYGAARGF